MLSDKHPKLIGIGTYGCVFHPSINVCNGKLDETDEDGHYITKIQQCSSNFKDNLEVKISKLVQTIPLYDSYFAPIVKTCKINMVNMDYNVVKTCSALKNDFGEKNVKASYISHKVRYVGAHTIATYCQSLILSPKKLYRKIINTHLHIIDAIQKLYLKNIIHFDLKPYNIMYDDIQDIPIIIDFGISRDITSLLSPTFNPSTNKELLNHTFINYDSYDYWCIDIYILSNIGQNTGLKLSQKVRDEHIKILLRGFFTPNFRAFLSEDNISQFKHNIYSYFSTYIQSEKTWQDVFMDLLQNYTSWDNYSVAMTYLYVYHKLQRTIILDDLMREYLEILKTIVISRPDKRDNAETTGELISELFSVYWTDPVAAATE